MVTLNLTANGKAQELILAYLCENASDVLAEKINSGTPFKKDGKRLINKKTLDGFMKYATDEARKLAEKGANSACVEDSVVYGWAIHYFEEESLEGKLYNEDGTEYTPLKEISKTSPDTEPVPQSGQQPRQASFFELLPDCNAPASAASESRTPENETQKAASIPDKKSVPDTRVQPSPFYKNYTELKNRYPDSVIAYRSGDFYEILGSDAIELATELCMTLTSRDLGLPERIPMIGFPYHAADIYFSKLIGKGYRLAIAENADELRTFPEPSIDEETGEILSERSPTHSDEDVPETREAEEIHSDGSDRIYEEEKAFARAFNSKAVCLLADLFGDCFILQ